MAAKLSSPSHVKYPQMGVFIREDKKTIPPNGGFFRYKVKIPSNGGIRIIREVLLLRHEFYRH